MAWYNEDSFARLTKKRGGNTDVLEGLALHLSLILCWVAPFSFVFCLVAAIKEAVNGGNNDISYGLGAAFSLLVIVAAVVLAALV